MKFEPDINSYVGVVQQVLVWNNFARGVGETIFHCSIKAKDFNHFKF